MTDTTELRTEGQTAANKNMRIGFYCLEAADEIERLRALAESNHQIIWELTVALQQVVAEYTKGKDDADAAGYMAIIAGKALGVLEQNAVTEEKRMGERCPKCSNYAIFGKNGERVCAVCGAFECA